jgi:DNA recombination protein RmuC
MQKDIGERLKVFGEIQMSLGQLNEVNKRVLEVSQEITSLQDLLKPPKLRGGVGETQLENILRQIFSGREEFYSFQHKFKDGTLVDAIIKVTDHIVPVDAKFPLESYERLSDAKTDEERSRLKKEFDNSIKNKIDETSKYIKPSEKTFDFALMYIPSEAIYYELIRDKKIWDYAINKNVIAVSANSLFPYLQVIYKGLKGLMIQKNVKAVIDNIKTLSLELNKLAEDFRLLGGHLTSAKTKFEDSEKRLSRFSDKLQNITAVENKQIEDKL